MRTHFDIEATQILLAFIAGFTTLAIYVFSLKSDLKDLKSVSKDEAEKEKKSTSEKMDKLEARIHELEMDMAKTEYGKMKEFITRQQGAADNQRRD